MNKPFVSICTPTFNRRPFIPFIINCVKNQTWDNFEWIIMDDGTDSVQDCFQDIPYAKYFRLENKISLGEKRNKMCHLAQGEIIVFMDDDDYYPPLRIQHAIETLQQHPNINIVGSSEMYIFFTSIQRIVKFGPYCNNHATAATMAFRKSWFINHPFPNQSVGEECIFLNNYTIPMIQLDPFKTILAFSHSHSTCDKNELLSNLDANKATMTDFTLSNWNIHSIDWIYYMNNYTQGNVQFKPDVFIELLENKNNRLIKENKELQTINYQLNIKIETLNKLVSYLKNKNDEKK